MADNDRLTPGQARIVDPILTEVARGYRNPMTIYEDMFPVVGVGARGGTIVEFGAEDFLSRDTRRAPGADVPRFTAGWSGKKFALVQRAHEYAEAIEVQEEAMAGPGIDSSALGAMKAKNIADLQIEQEAATEAQKAGNFGGTLALAGNAQWSNEASRPAKAVQTAKTSIRRKIGVDPNLLVVGDAVHDILVEHPDVLKRTQYVRESTMSDIDEALLARYFGVEKYRVGRVQKGAPGAFVPLWGKIAALVYVNVTPLAAMGSPSWSYTYRLRGYPIAEPAYYDRRARAWCYPYVTEDTPVVSGADAGYLFTGVVQ